MFLGDEGDLVESRPDLSGPDLFDADGPADDPPTGDLAERLLWVALTFLVGRDR
jgi:hypothetical protein